MTTLLSWSSGKDSAWALHVLRERGVEVSGLLTTVTADYDRVSMHGVRVELLRAQAEAVGLELWEAQIPAPCPNEIYEQVMARALDDARARGVTSVAFGDLYLEDIRRYREERLAPTGLAPLFPLWGRDTTELAREMVAGGCRAYLVCVDPKQCPRELAGAAYDAELLARLPAEVDPCGENGEFHTFVYDGPPFNHAVAFTKGQRETRDGFACLDLIPI